MKITSEDYKTIKQYVEKAFEQGTPRSFESQYAQKGLTPKRLRWDLLRYASAHTRKHLHKHLIGDDAGIPGLTRVYAYANDGHLDTALRQMMREFGMDWAAQK